MRVPEWLMLWPTVGMGLAFKLQPEMFKASPSFAQVAQGADQQTWAAEVDAARKTLDRAGM